MEFGAAFAIVAEKSQGEEEATRNWPRGQHLFSLIAAHSGLRALKVDLYGVLLSRGDGKGK